MTDYPKLRWGLEAFPVEQDGQRLILFRDRLGYCESPLIVTEAAAALMMNMNGSNSLRDLQSLFMRMTGELLFLEKIQEVVKKLDECLFLENERFIEMAAREVARFRRDPVRRMRHAGASYPMESEELRGRLEGFFSADAGGPGRPGRHAPDRPLVGLVAPHIDLQAGGVTFAHAYKASAEASSPGAWVVLGTGHEPVENYFALTRKDFETPLGLVRCDRECCDALLQSSTRDLLASEYNHFREHTIEFQAVFLAHVHPGATIVPLLCSFSSEEWEEDGAYIERTAESLRELGRTVGRPVGYIASVDLAHIGPRYGDRSRPDAGAIALHMASDRELLDCLKRCDGRGFMDRIRREQNRRRICGMAPLYVLARILEGVAEGEILHHGYAVVDGEGSFVTFAAMSFYEKADTGGR